MGESLEMRQNNSAEKCFNYAQLLKDKFAWDSPEKTFKATNIKSLSPEKNKKSTSFHFTFSYLRNQEKLYY